MTVTATTARVEYAGNGATTAFTVPFYFLANADLKVYQAGTLKTITTHYTVSGAGNPAGGTVTFGTAPAAGQDVVIFRDPAITQATDYTPNDPFPAESHERALDRLTMIAQRLSDRADRAFVLADSDVSGASTTLPAPEALGLVGWNIDATALVNYDAASITGSVASVDWIVDQFSGTGAQINFTLRRNPGVAANCDVSISGVTQVPGVDFTVSGTTLTFTTAPTSGTDNICVRYGSALPSGGTVGIDGVATASIQDGAVTTAKIAAGAVTGAKLNDSVVNDLTTVTVASGDYVMLADVSDSNKKKKGLASDIAALVTTLPAGSIIDYAGSSTPTGYLDCDGSAVSRSTYAALFSAISTTWGAGDGSTTFNLPNLNGRATIGSGTGTNAEAVAAASVSTGSDTFTVASNADRWVTGMAVVLTTSGGLPGGLSLATTYYVVRASSTTIKFATSLANAQNGTVIDITSQGTGTHTVTQTLTARTLGVIGGEETHAMSSTELLAHTHVMYSYGIDEGGTSGPMAQGGGSGTQANASTSSTGGNAAMNNMQPFAVVKKCIKT